MKFVSTALFATLFFCCASAQKSKFKSLLDAVDCKTEICIIDFMNSYGFSFINKEMSTIKSSGANTETSYYKKGELGDKKYITATFERLGDIAILEYKFTDGYTYQNLLKQLPQGFGSRKEILSPEKNAWSSKFLSKTNTGVAIVFKRPVSVGTTDPFVISIQYEK